VGRRTIRYRAHEIVASLQELQVGMLLQVTLKNGQTLTGNYQDSSNQTISIQDPGLVWYNKKKGIYKITLTEIEEISRDLVTLY
jgi:hypothetical protein